MLLQPQHARQCRAGGGQRRAAAPGRPAAAAVVRRAAASSSAAAAVSGSSSRGRLQCRCSSEAAVQEPAEAAAAAAPSSSPSSAAAAAAAAPLPPPPVPTSDVWELDFCSRPLLDERGKKVWELLVTDADRTFVYSQYFPNSKINSVELRKALEALLAADGAKAPTKARFFRGQMQTIISRALGELGIKPLPSRRCFSVMGLLEERLEQVYRPDPRFSDKASSLFTLDLGSPEPLPDALRGEKWAFVQLPLSALREMLASVDDGSIFGASFNLTAAGLGALPGDALVPGVAVFSRRAQPLAAWTNGLEIAGVTADVERSCLILEAGVNQRWRYGGWRPSPDSLAEAEGWEEAKRGLNGLHFLAVQPDADSESLNGLWLLLDRRPPNV